ncbi:MAG: hypothetical protein LBJ35_04910 [Spirochaetaceae bacterium]|jgi:hypothetical protein|nr:hypothetical protein [Spirochaetaceae bacterium]
MQKNIFFLVLLPVFISFHACTVETLEMPNDTDAGKVFAEAELAAVGTSAVNASAEKYDVTFNIAGGQTGGTPLSGCYINIAELLIDGSFPQSSIKDIRVAGNRQTGFNLVVPARLWMAGDKPLSEAGTIQINVRGAYLDYDEEEPVDPVFSSEKKSIIVTSSDWESILEPAALLSKTAETFAAGTINTSKMLNLAVEGGSAVLTNSSTLGGSAIVLPPNIMLTAGGTAAAAGTQADFLGPVGSLVLFTDAGGTIKIVDTGSSSYTDDGQGTLALVFKTVRNNAFTLTNTGVNPSGSLSYDIPQFNVLVNINRGQ